MNIAIIVAMNNNRIIGYKNQLPWHMPADLAHFKQITTGKIIVMGRKTYESIGKPLPNRTNIIVSRNTSLIIDGAEVVGSIDDVIALADKDSELMIIGGANFYNQTLDICTRLYITKINNNCKGDAYFPKLDNSWQVITEEKHKADNNNKYDYSFIMLERK